jgi:hypothetical protein
MITSFTANNKPIVVDPNLYNNWILPQTNVATATGDIRPKQTLDAYTVTDPTKNLRDRFIKWYQSAVNPTAVPTATELAVIITRHYLFICLCIVWRIFIYCMRKR